ncbi:MAG: type II toxin-antitoxin system prevent-host-death family antitoxin [Chloroflexi bacterium]|jgi:prevent-host-death family protein|nr:type II toxin-antitoxin system prevent-host-death family antitoxin [Chloroflexota bacterium]
MGEMTVGVRELRSRLSEYLRRVKQGETVVITERGKPVGRLIPQGQTLEERLAELDQAGLIRWSGKKLSRTKPVAKVRGRRTVAQTIVEDRR